MSILSITLLIVTNTADGDVVEPTVVDQNETWGQWRGPWRDGRCEGEDWPDSLDSMTASWRVAGLGDSYAGPIVSKTSVFSVESLNGKSEIVRAFDRFTGDELWRTEWLGAMDVPFFAKKNGSWIRSTPALDGDSLYIGGMRDVLVCLNANNGELRWQVDFCERYNTDLPSFGLVCSPLIAGESLYLQAAGSLICLDKRTGETRWRSLVEGGGMNSAFSSPTLAILHGREQLLVQTRNNLCSVDPTTGEELWKTPVKAYRGMNILTPTAWNDSVFTSAYGGRSLLFNVAENGEDQWQVEKDWDLAPQGYMTSPVLFDDHVYLFLRSNRFSCISLADGAVAWTSPPPGDEYWSLVLQGDRILALSDQGMLRLLNATPEQYEVIDEKEISEQQTWAHLAVAGCQVFVREQNAMSVFDWVE